MYEVPHEVLGHVLAITSDKLTKLGWDSDHLPVLAEMDLYLRHGRRGEAAFNLRMPTSGPIYGDIVTFLVTLAKRLTEDVDARLRFAESNPRLYGVCLIWEGWDSPTPSADLPPGLGHADMPDGYEVRFFEGMLSTGYAFQLEHRRGRRIEELRIAQISSDIKTDPTLESLRQILLMAMIATPDREAEIKALSAPDFA